MNSLVEFKEIQKFKQWWLLLLLFGIVATLIYALISQIIFNRPFGNNPASNTGLIIISFFTLLICFLFFLIKLETVIDKNGIQVRFYPLHIRYKKFNWNEIQSAEVREYKPLLEYGGWGIRIGLKGKAYNVSGNKGIQLVFKNGDKLLIGTNKPEEIKSILMQLNIT